jgi:hypothetical protein
MTDCPRLGKLFGGCKFEARYDRGTPTAEHIAALAVANGYTIPSDLEQFRPKTYVQDTCIRCGKVVKR